jgi:hypothetical protein
LDARKYADRKNGTRATIFEIMILNWHKNSLLCFRKQERGFHDHVASNRFELSRLREQLRFSGGGYD